MCACTCLEIIEEVRVLVITFHMVEKYVYLLFTRLASSTPSGDFPASVFHIAVGMVTSQMFSLNAALEKSWGSRRGFSHMHGKNSAYSHDSQSLCSIYNKMTCVHPWIYGELSYTRADPQYLKYLLLDLKWQNKNAWWWVYER